MSNTGKKTTNLKGLKLYNFLLKEFKELNAKKTDLQQLSIKERRKIVSEQLFPKFKTASKFSIRSIRTEINTFIKSLPPKEICNPLLIPPELLGPIEYYEIDNWIRTFLPACLDIRVNAGILGKTKIFNTDNYSYYFDGVSELVEDIREYLVEDESGIAQFDGVVKLKSRKKNDGNPANYFIDFILTINNVPQDISTGVNYDLSPKEEKKRDNITNYLYGKLKTFKKEKRKKARQAKKLKPKTEKEIKQNEAIKKALEDLKAIYKSGALSKGQYEAFKAEIVKNKK
jgi:hypothetical protein